jgi:hypothetical protein
VCKAESFAEVSGSGYDKEGMRGESSANDGAEQNMERSPKKVAVEQDKARGKKAENRTETGVSL